MTPPTTSSNLNRALIISGARLDHYLQCLTAHNQARATLKRCKPQGRAYDAAKALCDKTEAQLNEARAAAIDAQAEVTRLANEL